MTGAIQKPPYALQVVAIRSAGARTASSVLLICPAAITGPIAAASSALVASRRFGALVKRPLIRRVTRTRGASPIRQRMAGQGRNDRQTHAGKERPAPRATEPAPRATHPNPRFARPASRFTPPAP